MYTYLISVNNDVADTLIKRGATESGGIKGANKRIKQTWSLINAKVNVFLVVG